MEKPVSNFGSVSREVELEGNGTAREQPGTGSDDYDLIHITGHKPVLERNFNAFSLLAFSLMVVDPWVGVTSGLPAGISSGGTALLIYGTIAVSLLTMAVAISLAEISGAYPTSGGQYHWTAVLSPPRYAPILSWFCGYFNVAGFCVGVAAMVVLIGQAIMGIAVFCYSDITVKSWHTFICSQFFMAVFAGINMSGHKQLPTVNKISLYICIASFLAINITLLGTAQPKNSARFVFATFTNRTGWKSDGMAFIVGLINPAWCYGGLDNALHMVEEIRGARQNLPKILVYTVVLGFFTMIITDLTISFCALNLEKIISPHSGVPVLELFHQTTQNKAASIFLLCLILYLLFIAGVSGLQAGSRLIWAFARDGALPWSNHFQKVHSTLKVPVNATLLCWAIVAILCCVNLASTTAFTALASCGLLLTNVSFSLPIGLMFFGRRKYMKPTTFPLGNVWGSIFNAIALCWNLFAMIFFNFPLTMPARTGNMNYSSLIIGIVTAFSGTLWLVKGRKTYKGPKMDIRIDEAFHMQLASRMQNEAATLSVDRAKSA